MREEPVISRAIVKAALVLLVAGGLGVGAYVLVGGGIDIDLPDLPDVETATEEATTIDDTTLQDTTIGIDSEPEAPASKSNAYTSASLGASVGVLRDAVGPDAELTRVAINDVQTEFIVRRGDGIEAYRITPEGNVIREDATITISGDATLADFAFPLTAVDPTAIDRMLASSRNLTGVQDLRPSTLTLERAIPFGERKLEWAINAEGGGRYLTLRANADGTQVRNVGGKGVAIPPAAQEARKLNDCIDAAQGDADEIFACLDRFQ